MKLFARMSVMIALLGISTSALADGAGPINDMHYAIFDTDQTGAICFEVGGIGLAFISNGSVKHNAITALLISAFMSGKTISYVSQGSPMSPAPCQSFEFPASVYQVIAIAFQP